MEFFQTKLENGLQIIVESNEFAQSAAVGFFVRTGSRDETPEVSGVSHFLEHMVFKGTATRSADDVNRVFDELGAKYNASTSEELTLFYAAILPEYLSPVTELLADILFPALRDDDFEMEKKVILEEIGMYEDSPSFSAYDHAMQRHFAGHPLGQSILGSNESITALTADQMREYHKQRYSAENITLAITGKASPDDVVAMAEKFCSHWPSGNCPRNTDEAQPVGSQHLLLRDHLVQQHLVGMSPAPPAASPLRFAADLLSVIVGDDSGSRLYWSLVDPGYADIAEVGYNDYDGSGSYMTYLCCQPEEIESNLQRIAEIYGDVATNGVTEEELRQAKNKVASRVVLRSERPMGRLSSLGSNWLYRQEYRSFEQDLETLEQLTQKDMRDVLDAYPLALTTKVGIGPLKELAELP